jgi:hypothetical protein
MALLHLHIFCCPWFIISWVSFSAVTKKSLPNAGHQAEYTIGPEMQEGRKDNTLPLIALSLLVVDDP